jgi:SAM-dependent methyltransferase
MSTDAQQIAQFYASAQGAVVARLLRARLARFWPELPGLSVLGIGYAGPYLRPYLGPRQASRCIALTPAQYGPASFTSGGAGLSCSAEEDRLPFPDLSFDRILLIHGLEAAENARRLVREVWRVLKDDGRLLVVTPNRRGLWAHFEATPFGQGQPYSPGQIGQLLRAGFFRIERRDSALYMPPSRLRLVLRGAPMWERAGHFVVPQLAGVTITEATKDLYNIVPLGAASARRVVVTEPG